MLLLLVPIFNCLSHSPIWIYLNDYEKKVLSTTAGFPVNPVTASVYLKPGEPAVVRVQVTAPLPTDQDLDIMFVQDTSGSMADDIQIFRTLATSLVNAGILFFIFHLLACSCLIFIYIFQKKNAYFFQIKKIVHAISSNIFF